MLSALTPMPSGSALDITTLRLVKTGRRVIHDGIKGTVKKTMGANCWVLWDGNVYANYVPCASLEVIDEQRTP